MENPEYADEIRSEIKAEEPNDMFIWITFPISIVLSILILILYKIKNKDNLGMGILAVIPACIGFPFLLTILSSMFDFTFFLTWPYYLRLLYVYISIVAVMYRIGRNNSLINLEIDALENYGIIKKDNLIWLSALLIFPVTFSIYYVWFIFWNIKSKKRFAPRIGKITGKPLRRLGNSEEEKFLKKGQLAEEMVNSVDYDVWVSDDLIDIEIFNYDNKNSEYTSCPDCKAKTKYTLNSVTLKAADYKNSGQGKHIYQCKNCSYKGEELYTIPKLVAHSSGGGGSFGGGGGSFGGGGSSFGGGSSGGGGGGGSW